MGMVRFFEMFFKPINSNLTAASHSEMAGGV
jgi:hypothetical protein